MMAARPCRAAQPAVAADRFAREIVGFERRCMQRSRQLNGRPLGGSCAEGWLVLKPLFLVISLSDAVPLRRIESRVVWKPVLLDVIPVNAFAIQKHTEARGAGCGSGFAWFCRTPLFVSRQGEWCMPRFGVLWALPPNPPFQPTASRTRSVVFGMLIVARLRRLNGNPLARAIKPCCVL